VHNQCISGWNKPLLTRYLVGAPISIGCYFLIRRLLPYILEPIFRLLRIRAHYIPYSDYAKYISSCIKHEIPNGEISHHGEVETNGKHYQNPELLLAWVRIYTKFFLYLVFTYTVAVGVPVISEWILAKK